MRQRLNPMPREASPTTRAIMAVIELDGYRTGIGEHDGVWICTAKRDSDNQLHTAKSPSEEEAVAELAVPSRFGQCSRVSRPTCTQRSLVRRF